MTLPRFLSALLALLLFGVANLLGASLNEVRTRIADRLPQVVQLLRAGAVGEDNRGFLSRRGELSEKEQRVLAAENADRQALYTLLAEREGLKPEEVGRAQARQLQRLSARGFWIQDEEGDWLRKP